MKATTINTITIPNNNDKIVCLFGIFKIYKGHNNLIKNNNKNMKDNITILLKLKERSNLINKIIADIKLRILLCCKNFIIIIVNAGNKK